MQPHLTLKAHPHFHKSHLETISFEHFFLAIITLHLMQCNYTYIEIREMLATLSLAFTILFDEINSCLIILHEFHFESVGLTLI
jgi:hypothetical protein